MASASLSDGHDELECSVCRELFTEPKLLPCGHLLCRHCLVDWMKAQQEARCPLCRCAIFEEEQRALQSLEDVADGFPTDLAMEELAEAQRLLNKEHDCCVCEDVAATALCLNCGDMLCEACKEAHGNLLMAQSHIVEDLSSLTAEKVVANRQSTCEDHPDKTTELYCPTHGAFICLLCASSKHRNCPEVEDLKEKAEEARAKLAELAATLSAKQTELERAIGQLDLQDTREHTQASIAEMEVMYDRLESAIKACSCRLRELARSTCSDVKDSVHAAKACLMQRQGKMTSHKRAIQRAEGMKRRHALIDMTSAMQTCVAKLDCSATLPASAKVSTVTIVIDPREVSSVLLDLGTLGNVERISIKTVAIMRQPTAVSFHDNHGTGIVLSSNKQIARAEKWGNGVVMLRDPMAVNMLYEIRVERIGSPVGQGLEMGGYIRAGAVTQSPDDVIVPHSSWLLESAVVVSPSGITDLGTTRYRPSNLGSALLSNPAGRRVGMSLDSDHCLHLHVDGQRQGMVARDVPQPCYALFDVISHNGQVTLLPVKPLSH